ncbi:MAG: tyrosine-type recombinase/integrase [Bifidobacterium sp.]|nr:tyrosine-type recombinase/integrase [Bifidobacterium sp.]
MEQSTVDLVRLCEQWTRALAPSTRRSYAAHIRHWVRWCGENAVEPGGASRVDIERYSAWLHDVRHDAKTTQRNAVSAVCGLYRYAVEEGLLREDPGLHVRKRRIWGHSTGTSLTREQAARLLEHAEEDGDPTVGALCSTLLLTGARIGETLGLGVEDYHARADRPYLRFHRKGEWEQDVAIGTHVSTRLDRMLAGRKSGPLFIRPDGLRVTHSQAQTLIRNLADDLGIPGITPHSLRRTFCTLSRDAGIDDRDIMASGGWTSTHMLHYYDMASRGMKSKAPDRLAAYLG